MSASDHAGLGDGIAAFADTTFVEHADLFTRLSTGQAPDVCFVTCADSRVDPNLITGALPGDLFVVRNAGNMVPPQGGPPDGTVASVEYAIVKLGVSHVVVCGHSDCGAMSAVLQPPPWEVVPEVSDWLTHAPPSAVVDGVGADHRLARLIEANVLRQLGHVAGYDFVARRLAEGTVQLHGWVYDIATGRIDAANTEGSFAPIG